MQYNDYYNDSLLGANFLLNVVKRFDELLKIDQEVENKQLDNTVHIIAELYNFKVSGTKKTYFLSTVLNRIFNILGVPCTIIVPNTN